MTFKNTKELEANFEEQDLQILANVIAAGEDFDEAYSHIVCGYDDCDPVYFNSEAYKEDVKEYCKNLIPELLYEVSIKLTNFTLLEAKDFVKKLEEGQVISLNSSEHKLKKSNIKVRYKRDYYEEW